MAFTAKDVRIAPIDGRTARALVERYHYSGRPYSKSQLHLGAFLGTRCHGVMSFGPPLDRRKLLPLVAGTRWDGVLELNRMAFSDALPRNSESRALAVAMRLLRRHAPQVQWIVSYADGAQCGDGTIYRAAGFVLTQIKRNTTLWRTPAGEIVSDVGIKTAGPEMLRRVGGTALLAAAGRHRIRVLRAIGCARLDGYQLRYLYFLDPSARERLTVPIIPFSRIAAMGAGMYRGKPRARAEGVDSDTPAVQAGEGGATPTSALSVGAA